MSTGVLALTTNCPIVCVDPDGAVEILASHVGFYEQRGTLYFVRKMLEHFGKSEQVHLLTGCFSCLSSSYDVRYFETGGNAEYIKPSEIVGVQAQVYKPYDLIFIDGDHSTSAVYSDLLLAHSMLSERGIIILHDVEGAWGEQVMQGIYKFLQEHTKFSLKADHYMGFLSRDTEKAWLPPLTDPFSERLRRKARMGMGIGIMQRVAHRHSPPR